MGPWRPFTDVKGVTAQPVTDFFQNNLLTRIVSAVVMIPPVLAAVYAGYPYFHVLVAAVAVAMAWEWRRIVAGGAFGVPGLLLAMGALASVVTATLGLYAEALALVALSGGLAAVVGGQRAWMALGAFYVGIPSIALVWVRGDAESGLLAVVWLLILVWAADSGAYAAGRLIGGPKMAPSISPNKTWAGLAGCGVGAAVAGTAVIHLAGGTGDGKAFLISGLIGLISQGGDLLESALKRRFGVKDSSNLIPGHGGVLDRVDALLAAVTAAAALSLLGVEGLIP